LKPGVIDIKFGFPPKSLDNSDDTVKLSNLNVKSGETLLVRELPPCSADLKESSSAQNNSDCQNTSREYVSANDYANDVMHNGLGILMREVVPANNSCLFLSVDYVMNGGKLDLNCVQKLRKIVSDAVKKDPIDYNEALLGKPNHQYADWILKEQSWGGAIELAVFCNHYKVEIVVINSMSGAINRFGEDKTYPHRVLLIYDGIHYDPIKLCMVDSDELVETIFSTFDDSILVQALDLANEAKSSRQFTDTAKFNLKCLDCRINLIGEKGAQEHAEKTGHTHFGEL